MGERAVRAYAAAWTAIYAGGDAIAGFYDVSFTESLLAALFGLFVSVMFSLAGKKRGAEDSASLLDRGQDPPLPAAEVG
jgi:hypothetical protein